MLVFEGFVAARIRLVRKRAGERFVRRGQIAVGHEIGDDRKINFRRTRIFDENAFAVVPQFAVGAKARRNGIADRAVHAARAVRGAVKQERIALYGQTTGRFRSDLAGEIHRLAIALIANADHARRIIRKVPFFYPLALFFKGRRQNAATQVELLFVI